MKRPDIDAIKSRAIDSPDVSAQTRSDIGELIAWIQQTESRVREHNEKMDRFVDSIPDEAAPFVFVAMREAGIIGSAFYATRNVKQCEHQWHWPNSESSTMSCTKCGARG